MSDIKSLVESDKTAKEILEQFSDPKGILKSFSKRDVEGLSFVDKVTKENKQGDYYKSFDVVSSSDSQFEGSKLTVGIEWDSDEEEYVVIVDHHYGGGYGGSYNSLVGAKISSVRDVIDILSKWKMEEI